MVPVTHLDEASVVLTITDDPVIHAFAARSTWRGRELRIADPLQTWWDTAHSTGRASTKPRPACEPCSLGAGDDRALDLRVTIGGTRPFWRFVISPRSRSRKAT
jgi:hypothetical protein